MKLLLFWFKQLNNQWRLAGFYYVHVRLYEKLHITKWTLLSCIYQLQQSYAACARISFSNPRSQHLGSILSRENTTWEIWKNMGNQHSHIWWEWNNLPAYCCKLLQRPSGLCENAGCYWGLDNWTENVEN